jgi:hypothetical protein
VSVIFLAASGHQVEESWSATLTAVNTLSLRNVLSVEHVAVGQNGAMKIGGGVMVRAGIRARDGVRVQSGRVSVLQGSAIYGQMKTDGKYSKPAFQVQNSSPLPH